MLNRENIFTILRDNVAPSFLPRVNTWEPCSISIHFFYLFPKAIAVTMGPGNALSNIGSLVL